MRKVLELKGVKSLTGLNAFSTLMIGLKMLPMYMGEGFEEFYDRIHMMPPSDQEKMVREAILLVNLRQDEVEALACFATDANGVPYTTANLKNLAPQDLIEILVSVCMEYAKIKVNFVSEAEKKNLKISQSTSVAPLQDIQH